MTYIIYFLFSLVLCVSYILEIKRLEKKAEKFIYDAIDLAKLQISALEQERQYYLNKEIDNYPNIKEYVGQSSSFLDIYYNLDRHLKCIKFVPYGDATNISEEYINSDDDIKKLVLREIGIVNRLYRITHPAKYRFEEFKKNLMLQILKVLVSIYGKTNTSKAEECEKSATKYKYSGRLKLEAVAN